VISRIDHIGVAVRSLEERLTLDRPVLREHFGGPQAPAYCGVRTRGDFVYVRYATGEEELYDLRADPNELTNVVSAPQYAAILDVLRDQTHQLCDPPPPGFTWSH